MKEPPARDDTPPAAADDPQLLAEQIAYYRERAAEYDAVVVPHRALRSRRRTQRRVARRRRARRSARSPHSSTRNAPTTRARARLRHRALHAASRAARRRASPRSTRRPKSSRSIARRVGARQRRLRRGRPVRVAAAARYDLVFMSFWLSHVPPARFDAFWTMVRARAGAGRLRVRDRFGARSDVDGARPSAAGRATRAS